PREGDAIWQVGLDVRNQLVVRETTVDRVRPMRLPFPDGRPQFRDKNIEIVTLADTTSSVGGVLVNKKGAVQAFWMSFHMANDDNDSIFRGLPVDVVKLALQSFESGSYRSLGLELDDLPLA